MNITAAEKIQLCFLLARGIVALHRAEVPAGCDPQNSWIALGVAVVGGTVSAIQANKASKDQKAAAQQNAERMAGNKLPEFNPPPAPAYIPFDFAGTQAGAINEDRLAYQRSDNDFARRHGSIVEAEKLFEQSVLDDQRGVKELPPDLQAEFMRAGIGGALSSLGDMGALEPGSAGEASVARNLGLGIMDFQDRNRRNRMQSLGMAEEIFPRREFGMNGQDFALTALQDAVNQNAYNQANYATEANTYEKNYNIAAGNQNAQTQSENALAEANAQAIAAQAQAYRNIATSVVGAGAQAYGARGGSAVPAGAVRPKQAMYPGSNTWVPVGRYA